MRLVLLLALLASGCALTRAPVLPPALEQQRGPANVELADVPFFAQRDYQCGPASLAMALRYTGVAVAPDDLVTRVYLPGRQGSLALEMLAATRAYGRVAYPLRPQLSALLAELQEGRPVVVLQNLGIEAVAVWHFAVVVGYDGRSDRVILRSGERERVEQSGYEFLRTWVLAGQWAMAVLRPGELPAADDAAGYVRALAAAEAARQDVDLRPAWEAAVQRWPDSTLARFGAANALYRTGDAQGAVAAYIELLSLAPGDLAARNNLADALRSLGCRVLARDTLADALRGAAHDDPLRPALERTQEELGAGQAHAPEPADCAHWRVPRMAAR
jgi:tetratricopeptide (TPR) repeat protein